VGTLRGYDAFLNVVLEDAINESPGGGGGDDIGTIVIRGNSIIQFESVDRITT
jgi:small nuclear ribonucleoprotein G